MSLSQNNNIFYRNWAEKILVQFGLVLNGVILTQASAMWFETQRKSLQMEKSATEMQSGKYKMRGVLPSLWFQFYFIVSNFFQTKGQHIPSSIFHELPLYSLNTHLFFHLTNSSFLLLLLLLRTRVLHTRE